MSCHPRHGPHCLKSAQQAGTQDDGAQQSSSSSEQTSTDNGADDVTDVEYEEVDDDKK